MENLNCLRCRFRHEDNGNCTAIGGFCTAVPAAHCQLLREYLDTGLTPEKIERSKLEIEAGCMRIQNHLGHGFNYCPNCGARMDEGDDNACL